MCLWQCFCPSSHIYVVLHPGSSTQHTFQFSNCCLDFRGARAEVIPMGRCFYRALFCLRFFDTSKQALGAAVVHFANVFLADMFHGDPCTWWVICSGWLGHSSIIIMILVVVVVSTLLSLAGNSGRLTWVRHISCESSATHSCQCV